MVILRFLTVLMLTAGTAAAGAWPRESGTTFLSFNHTISEQWAHLNSGTIAPSGFSALMVEHGAAPRLTFGLDAGYDESGDFTVFGYVTRSLGPEDAANRFAAQAGLGVARRAGVTESLLHLGASWGRGLETPWGSGWAAADTTLFYRPESDAVAAKLDLTLGVNVTDAAMLFVQMQSGRYPDADPYLRLVPSFAYEYAPGRHLELGVPFGVVGNDGIGIKLGSWITF